MSYVNLTIGSDIKLNKNGDISVGNNGDIELASNDVNILQSARMCVMTSKGIDEYNPNYGSDLNLYKSLPNIPRIRIQAAAEIANALLKNAKIKNVTNVLVKKENDTTYSVECGIVPIDQDRIYNIVFPVRT